MSLHFAEQLEPRRLLAAAVQVSLDAAGTLEIRGTPQTDRIGVVSDLDTVRVLVNGVAVLTGDPEIVQRAVIDGRGGDDFLGYSHFGTVTILGGAGDDDLYVGPRDFDGGQTGASAFLLDGGRGNDWLGAAWVGTGVMLGGAGDDQIGWEVTSGLDLRGGDGNDRFYNFGDDATIGGVSIDGGAGFDTWDWNISYGASFVRIPPGVERLRAAVAFQVHGNELDNVIEVGGIDTTVRGGPGNDVIRQLEPSSTYDFTFFGEAGNDLLIGGGGNDHLDGGDGFDILLGADGDDTLNGGPGFDLLFGGDGFDTAVAPGNDLLFSVEQTAGLPLLPPRERPAEVVLDVES